MTVPDGFEFVGRLTEFSESRPRLVEVGGRTVAVFRRGERLFAIQDYCPHMGASLALGRLVGDHIVCGWHDWRWHVEDGGCGRPSGIRARTYEVHESGGEVWLRQRPHPDDEPPEPDDEPWVEWSDDFLKSSKKDGSQGDER